MEANELSGPCAMWAFGKLLGNGAFPGEYCAVTGKPGGRGGPIGPLEGGRRPAPPYSFLRPRWSLISSRTSSRSPLQYVSRGLRTVALLCVALVVELTLVKGLGGTSWSSFSMILCILRAVSVGETIGFGGGSGCVFMTKFQ